MPLPLGKEHVAERLRNYARDNYLFIGSIAKGGAIAAATFVGLSILSDWPSYWPSFTPWVASLVAINVSYMTWGRGILLTNAHSNIRDSVFPLLMGLFEFSLFGVLLSNEKQPLLFRHWFLVLALHSFFAVLLVTNRVSNTNIERDFECSLHGLARSYLKWMHVDRIGAGVVSCVSLVIWVVMNWYVWPQTAYGDQIHTILAGLAAVFLLKPIFDADNQRRHIDEVVSKSVMT